MNLKDWEKDLIGDTQRKKINKEVKETVTNDDGEKLFQRHIEESYVSKEPDYVKIYLDNILQINNLSSGIQKTLNVLLKRMAYDNIVVLNAYIKNQMAEELGFNTVQSLNNNINKLVKEGIMIRKGTGTYEMNPFLFGRGSWDNIKKIRFQVIFEEGKISQKADFDYKDEVAISHEEKTTD
ncbi:replication/maintenance protein RepL [Priestia megaterium]